MRTSGSLAAPAALGGITALVLGAPLMQYARGTFTKLQAWTPSVDEMLTDLTYSPPPEADVAPLVSWGGMPFYERGALDAEAIAAQQRSGIEFFDGCARLPGALGHG